MNPDDTAPWGSWNSMHTPEVEARVTLHVYLVGGQVLHLVMNPEQAAGLMRSVGTDGSVTLGSELAVPSSAISMREVAAVVREG